MFLYMSMSHMFNHSDDEYICQTVQISSTKYMNDTCL